MLDNIIQTTTIQRVTEKNQEKIQDCLAVESPLEIRIGYDCEKAQFFTLSITLCSPSDIDSLVVGYLFSERIIKSFSEVINIEIYTSEFGVIAEVKLDKKIVIDDFLHKRQSIMHSSCGVCGKTEFDDLMIISYPEIKPPKTIIHKNVINSLPRKLNNRQLGFTKTGGVHACGLFNSKGELLFLKEDIGRHNALDKLIGLALLKDLLPLSDYILLLSGRVSFELVHKALLAGVSTLVAIGAPSTLAVELANSNGLSLFGFAKSNSYNNYTMSPNSN